MHAAPLAVLIAAYSIGGSSFQIDAGKPLDDPSYGDGTKCIDVRPRIERMRISGELQQQLLPLLQLLSNDHEELSNFLVNAAAEDEIFLGSACHEADAPVISLTVGLRTHSTRSYELIVGLKQGAIDSTVGGLAVRVEN